MRQLVLSPRWIMWHLLTLGAMATCVWLAAWQWGRAGSSMGSALNVGYGLQWPAFAAFFGVMWWRMLRMEAARVADGPLVVPDDGADGPPVQAPAPPAAALLDGPSPFGPRPTGAVPAVSDEDDPELAAYNRMLAQLAARPPED